MVSTTETALDIGGAAPARLAPERTLPQKFWRFSKKRPLGAISALMCVIILMVAIGGSVIIETVMGMNGVGRNYITAVQQRDYPLVQGILLVLVSATLATNLLVDLSYSWLDPRIRY